MGSLIASSYDFCSYTLLLVSEADIAISGVLLLSIDVSRGGLVLRSRDAVVTLLAAGAIFLVHPRGLALMLVPFVSRSQEGFSSDGWSRCLSKVNA